MGAVHESARWYSHTVLGLLKEQRERALMKSDDPPMSEAELKVPFEKAIAEGVMSMPEERLRKLLADRDATIARAQPHQAPLSVEARPVR